MTQSSDALEPGTRLEEFTIERVLGWGGCGVSYLARDESLEVSRALKEYLPHWATRREEGRVGPRREEDANDFQWCMDRFVSMVRGLAKVRHGCTTRK